MRCSWPDHVKLAVNLSAVQFRGANLVDMVSSALALAGFQTGRLELEVTESVLLQAEVRRTLDTLHGLGLGSCWTISAPAIPP